LDNVIFIGRQKLHVSIQELLFTVLTLMACNPNPYWSSCYELWLEYVKHKTELHEIVLVMSHM